MATSQNGRTVLETAPPRRYVPGTGLIPGRLRVHFAVAPGDDGTILIEVARRFHQIEPIDDPVAASHGTRGVDDWGWAYRPVRGQDSGFSNHASGTAIDLNATEHPRGVRGTFDNRTKTRIRQMLDLFRDPSTGARVVRWGEDYTTTIDGMHFEIIGTRQQARRVADDIRARKGAFAEHDEGEDDDMQTTDMLTLGPANAAELGQKDAKVSVGEALSGTWAEALRTRKRLDQLIAEQRTTNERLGELVKLLMARGGA